MMKNLKWMLSMASLAVVAGAMAFPWQQDGLKAGEKGVSMQIEGKGEVLIRLYSDQAPQTTKRVWDLAGQKFYDNQKFFKVVKSPRPFLVQLGDPTSREKSMDDPSLGTYSTGTKIAYENSGFKHVRGAVGFSRLPENRNSGDTQFYIMLDAAPFLDGQYTVFGQVIKGMDLIDKVALGDKITSVKTVQN